MANHTQPSSHRPAADALRAFANLKIAILGLLTLCPLVIGARFLDMTNDDAFITYRYSENALRGAGLVFNPGERILATTSPLHALILIPAGYATADLPIAANLLSMMMLLILCWSVFCLLEDSGYRTAGVISALLISLNVWTYAFFPLETVTLLGLEFTAIYLYTKGRLTSAAAVCGLAVLTRFDAVALLAAMIIHNTLSARCLKRLLLPAASFLAVTMPWLLFSAAYYGSAFPNTIAAKTGVPGGLTTFLSALWPRALQYMLADSAALSAVALIFAFVGFWPSFRARKLTWLLGLWSAFHIAAYSILRIIYPHSWYYYPLTVNAIILATTGACASCDAICRLLSSRHRRNWLIMAAAMTIALLITQTNRVLQYSSEHKESPFTSARTFCYQQIAEWVVANTDPDASVATLEIGILGFFSHRRVIDLLGLATPAAAANAKRGKWWKSIEPLKPDYVIIQNRSDTAPWDTAESKYLMVHGEQMDHYPRIKTLSCSKHMVNIYKRVEKETE